MLFNKDSQSEFLKKIDLLVLEGNHSYIDAVLEISDEYEIEPTIAAKYLTKPIIEKLEKEGRECNLLPRKTSELPI
tara:strand:- start:113 stop:340 length:228 start_codon:yes stop_codon:yes gene_type:complete